MSRIHMILILNDRKKLLHLLLHLIQSDRKINHTNVYTLTKMMDFIVLVALEKQRQEYERQFQHLRNILSPSTPYAPYMPFDPFRPGRMTPCTPVTAQMRVEKWTQDRDEIFRRSLTALKSDIVKANALVQEANFLAQEMDRATEFSVTLQIPPANLSPNRKVNKIPSTNRKVTCS